MANTMKTKEKVKRQAEAKERLKKEPRLGDYKKQAEKLSADPHKNDAERIRHLKGGKSLEKQVAAVHFLEITLDKLLKRLNEKGVDLSKIKTAKDLQREVTKNSLSLNVAEAVLVERLPEITSGDGSAGEHIGEMLKEKSNKLWVVKSLSNLRGNEPLSKQKDAVAILDQAMVKLIAKLAKADADISGIDRPSKLKEAIRKHNIETTEQEKAAILAFTRMSASNGETAKYVKKEWSKTREAGVEASKGYFDKYMEHFNKNPAGTAALSVAAVAGVYLGAKALAELFKMAIGSEDKDEKKGKGKWNKKVMVATAAAVAGLFFGRGKVKEMFASVGLDFFDMEKRVEEGKEFTAEQKKKIEKGGSAIKKKVGEMKKEAAKKRVRTGAGVAVESAGGRVVERSEGVETSKSRVLNSEVAGDARELLKDSTYDAPKQAFISIYFHSRYEKGLKPVLNETVDDISQEKISKVQAAYSKYKETKKIPKSAFPSVKSDISDANLFLLVESMLKFSKLTHTDTTKKGMTVQQMFEQVWENPLARQASVIGENLKEAMRNGNLSEAMASIAVQSVESVKHQAKQMAERLDEALNISAEKLSKDDKVVYRKLQTLLMTNHTLLRKSPESAIATILKPHPEFNKHPNAVNLAKEFFAGIKEKTPALLDKSYDKFNIPTDDYLKKGVNVDSIQLFNACELVLMTTALEGSGDEVSDMALLSVLLKSFNNDALRERYIGQLAGELGKDFPDIKIPGIKNIKPYVSSLLKIAGTHLGFEVLSWANKLTPYQEGHSTTKSHGEMAEEFKSDFLISFAAEAGGTGLELSANALASIVLALGLEDDLASVESGKDFLDLIRVNGGHIGGYKDRDGSMAIIIGTGWDVFVARPTAIAGESLSSLLDGEYADAAKIWVGGSAFFVSAGMIKGFLKTTRAPDGSGRVIYALRTRSKNAIIHGLRGLKYPIKAPWMVAKAAANTTQTIFSGAAGARSLGKAAKDAPVRTLNWGKDVLRYGSPGQNIENSVLTQKRFEYHLRMGRDMISTDISDADSAFKRYRKQLAASMKKAKRTGKGLIAEPTAEVRRWLTGNYHARMAKKFAVRRAGELNDFLMLPDRHLFSTGNINNAELKLIEEASGRFNNFLSVSRNNPKLLDELLDMSKKLDAGESTADSMTVFIKDRFGLAPLEAKALAKRMEHPSKAKQIVEQLRRGIKYQDKLGSVPKLMTKTASDVAKKANKIDDIFDTTRKFGEVVDELAGLEKELTSTEKIIAKARLEMDLAKKANSQKRVDDARQMMQDAEIAKTRIKASMEALEKVGEAETKLASVSKASSKEATKLYIELQRVTDRAEDALSTSNKATQSIGKLGKFGTGLKYAGRGLAIGGSIFSAGMAVSAGHEALTTDNKERAGVKGIEAGMWTVNAVADTAAVAVMFGAGGTVAGGAAAAALPLIPITYVGETILENEYEKTLTAGEWAQKNPYELLHHFYTSVNSVSLADAWEAGFKSYGAYAALGSLPGIALGSALEKKSTDKEVEKINATKIQTLQKIYRALIAMESDPSLMQYMNKTKASPEKDKEVERRIDKAYTVNHSFFFRENNKHGVESNMGSYASARRMIMDAQIFNRIMSERDIAKKAGRSFMIGNIDLTEDRYEIIGGVEDPKWQGEKAYGPQVIVNVYKRLALKSIEGDVVIADNLEKMDSPYLLRLMAQMRIALSDKSRSGELDEIPGLKKDLLVNYTLISSYLNYKRNVDVDRALGNHREPIMTAKEISEHLSGFGKLENKAYAKFEKQNTDKTPALHAMFRLAEYFGYNGEESEDKLKEFFSEDAGKYRGVYWDGSEWVVAEAGWESDDELGSELTTSVVKQIIKSMRETPDNILEHRRDSVFMDAYDYSAEVLGMAAILDKGLKEGAKRGYERKSEELKKEIVEAPVAFNPKKIDYNKASPELKKDYYKAIEHVIASTGWRQLRNNVRDDHTIDLSRGDNKGKTRLYREGNKWNVDGFQGGLDLLQAITLGNLKNKIHDMKEGAGSKRPFELDDGVIQFDRNWSFIETDVLSDKQGWLSFFDEIGLSKQKVVTALNNWVETGDNKKAFAEKSRRDRIEKDKKSSTKARS